MKLEVHFDKDIGVWSSPNAPSLITPVLKFKQNLQPELTHKSLREIHWLHDYFPFLAFWPFEPLWSGSILGRLNVSYYSTPLEHTPVYRDLYQVKYNYRIAGDVAAGWHRLEGALVGLAKFLLIRRRPDFAHLRFTDLPSDCGYKNWHKSEHHARACVGKTQFAFLTLTAICSFAIALNMPYDSPNHDPEWVTACQNAGVHPEWLAELRRTFVCDFSPGFRTGAYVDGWTTPWAGLLHAFNVTGTPLFIVWGHSRLKQPRYIEMEPHIPTNQAVQKAKSWSSQQPPGGLATSAEPPMPHQGSRQRRGETQKGFVSRMLQDEEEFESTEDEQDKESRLERVRQAAADVGDSKILEPRVGTAMFEWVDHPGGYMLRTQVPRAEWKSRWQLVSCWDKRYYSVLDEWDLESVPRVEAPSVEVPPEVEEPPAPIADDDDSPSLPDSPSPIDLPAPDFSGFVFPHEVFREDLEITLADLLSLSQLEFPAIVPDSHVEPLPLIEALHYRYGFLAQVPYNPQGTTTPSNPHMQTELTDEERKEKRREILHCAGILAVKHAKNTGLEQAVIDLYTLLSSSGDEPVASQPLWDFTPALRDTIFSHKQFYYHRVSSHLHLIGMKAGPPLHKQWYLLALKSATTVLQIFRTQPQPRTHGDITRKLISNGVPFSTVKCLWKPPQGEERVSVGLGRRQEFNIKPDTTEYLTYEIAKRDLLNTSVGRVALMKGGIVWRLAKDIVKDRAVLNGPSSLSATDGFVVGRKDSFYLVDDKLDAAAEDVICGVYHVLQGDKAQAKELSWWPKASTWENSGLDVGYWSEDCEDFYQRRLEEIRKGEAVLLPAKKWRDRIKFKAHQTAQFRERVDQLSDTLLQGGHSYWRQS